MRLVWISSNQATGGTTGSSMPSAKDPSTQRAGTAGSAEKKGGRHCAGWDDEKVKDIPELKTK
jgi:hypothetical protein